MAIVECPQCKCQLEVRVSFASSPKSAVPVDDAPHIPIGAMLKAIEDDQSVELTPWEEDFIAKQSERYEKYGETIRMTEKQMGALKKVYSRFSDALSNPFR